MRRLILGGVLPRGMHLETVLPRVEVTCPRLQCGLRYDLLVLDDKPVITTVECPKCGVTTHVQTRPPPFTKEEGADYGANFH